MLTLERVKNGITEICASIFVVQNVKSFTKKRFYSFIGEIENTGEDFVPIINVK
jgi:hypothetical protein